MGFSIGRGTLLGTGYISITADIGDAEAKMGLLGKGLAGAAVGFTALAAAAAGTVAMASKFNSEMLKVQTQAGASAGDVKVLSSQILNLKNVQQGPDQLSESMYHLKSIGLDNVSAMKDLKVASDLASVGSSNLEDTTNALGGAWRSGIKGAQTFAMAAGTVNAIIGAGNMRMGDFVSAIGTGILPAAKTFGVSLSQVGAGLALMTDEGVPAVDAATRLKMSFSLLAAPSDAASKQLAKIGLTGLEMANTMRGPTGLVGTIQLLKDHLDASGLSLSQQAILLSHAFGGGRSSSAILTMVNNVGVLKGKLDQINDSAAKLPAAIAAQQATLSAQLKMFEVQMEDTGIKIGEHLIGPVVQFMTFVNATLLPGIGKITSTLAGMVPVDKIKSDFNTLTAGLSAFFDAASGGGSPAKKVAQKFTSLFVPAGPARTGVPFAQGAASFQGALRPGAAGTGSPFAGGAASFGRALPKAPTLSGSPFRNSAPSFSTAIAGAVGPQGVPFTNVPIPAVKVKAPAPPDVSAWTKAANTIRGALDPIVKGFLGLKSVVVQVVPPLVSDLSKVADAVGKLLGPAFNIVVTFLTKTFFPVLHNMGSIASQLLPDLQPLVDIVGIALYGALQSIGFILNNVVGPTLVAVTGFFKDNHDEIYVLLGVLTLLNAQTIIAGTVMKAQAVWTGIVTAAQWAWNLAMDASPIGLTIVAIGLLVAGIVWVATKTTWFQTAWKYTWDFLRTSALDTWHFLDNWVIHPIATAFTWLWKEGIEPAIRFIVDAFLNMAGLILKGASLMLGWIPGIGGQLKNAVKAFNSFRDGVNAALGGVNNKNVTVGVTFSSTVPGSTQKRITAATGGPIQGPGTGTSDSIPAMLSNNEHVWTAKEVDAAGGHGAVTRMRKDVLSGKRFAAGGPVHLNIRPRTPSASAVSSSVSRQVVALTQSRAQALYDAIQQRLAATIGGVIPAGAHLAIINAAMAAAGVPPPGSTGQWQAGLNTLIGRESGWNPNAINLTDSNALAGHPSQGLAQTIPGTFNAYHAAGTSYSITDPVANVAAAIKYIVSRYGNISNVQQANANLPPQGYDSGGWLMPGKTLAVNNTGRPERVIGPRDQVGGDTYVFNFTGPVGSQAELENWLVKSLTTLKQRRRLAGLVGS